MSEFLLYSRTGWSDYFTTTNPTNRSSQLYTSRENPSDASLYFSNCLFRSITSSSTGGALYCTSVKYLLVESTSFFSCKTSNSGGAIYFSNSGGQCVLHGVCGYDCCTTSSSDYQFAHVYVNNDVSSKNYVNYSSIVRCVNVNAHYMLYLYYGKICFTSLNSSLNKCISRSGIHCVPNLEPSYDICSLLYSSFTDNNAVSHSCVAFWHYKAYSEIKSCNILRNTQDDLNTYGIITSCGYLMIEDSCILQNTANCIFSQANTFTITISNCTVDSFSNNGYLTIQSTVTKSFILVLNHMSTQNCHSEYDVAGTLTPNVQPTSKNQGLCYTCEKYYYQLPQGNLFSLFSLFVFNFIHPYASIDSLH
jgi:hypothetical protein